MVPLCLVPAFVLFFFYVSTFQSMCAVSNIAVFCSSLTSWFPVMSLTYFLNNLEMVPVAPIITGITLVFTFHMRCISIVSSLYFKIFSASSFLITFLSPVIATSIFSDYNVWLVIGDSSVGYYYYYYYYYWLQLSCHPVAVILTLVQTKQIRILTHKRNNTENAVQTIQNTVNTGTRFIYSPEFYLSTN